MKRSYQNPKFNTATKTNEIIKGERKSKTELVEASTGIFFCKPCEMPFLLSASIKR